MDDVEKYQIAIQVTLLELVLQRGGMTYSVLYWRLYMF